MRRVVYSSSEMHQKAKITKEREMALLEALSSTELLNFIIFDSLSSSSSALNLDSSASQTHFLFPQNQQIPGSNLDNITSNNSSMPPPPEPAAAVQGRKKRRRRQRVCKNKEEAETQRMVHIAVERNRRKQMNEHLAVLRSLMPESYVQRGDQASIVGGAIEFVKELEHHLQSLEAQKFILLQQQGASTAAAGAANDNNTTTTTTATATASAVTNKFMQPNTTTPFAQFFTYPQYTCSSSSCHLANKYTSKNKAAIADIEVTLIETHANVRILSRRRFRQLSKMVTGFQALYLSILHLNVTTLDPLVLYSISAKAEEGCVLNSADDIAGAVHHILRIIEEEATLCGEDSSLGLPCNC